MRLLEKIKIHNYRQPFYIGFLKKHISVEDLKNHLIQNEFENAVLAWKDPGEILSMRKTHDKIFQYHIRLFEDREVRGHYEYSSEGNPFAHVNESTFEKRTNYFKELLNGFIEKNIN